MRGRIGLILLALNVPVGWGGAAVCGILATAYKSNVWGIAAIAIYVLSWIMLGLGFLLVGKNLIDIMKRRRAIVFGAWKRLRAWK